MSSFNLDRQIIAIIRLPSYERPVEVAKALLDGGISVMEFTLTGEGAHDAVRDVRSHFGDSVTVGLGTVLEPRHVDEAAGCGAQFIVTPVTVPAVIERSRGAGLPIVCGAYTPTEAYEAHRAGADFIKLFPARALGPGFVKDLLAPLPFLKVIPTGGVSADNLRTYLEAGATAVGVGGNLVAPEAVREGRFDLIRERARALVDAR